jgi:uncharacterized membrane protein YphA (DoxX/SURF4 family)
MTLSLGITLAALFALTGTAKLAAVPAMRSAAQHLGYTTGQYRGIGALELAAAAGTVIGLAVRWIGVLAAIGLVVLMLGAVGEHIRHRDGAMHTAVPVVVAALAAAYLLLLS